MQGREPENHSGRTYKHWTVVKRGERQTPSVAGLAIPWLCLCSVCGHEQWLIPGKFKYDSVAKCECCAAKRAEERAQAAQSRQVKAEQRRAAQELKRRQALNGEVLLDVRWKSIVRGAAKRGIAFNVTKDEAMQVYHDQNKCCALTGTPLTLASSVKHIGTASLDRIDGSRPYEAGNVHWVHKHINMMKSTFGSEYFMALCTAVANQTPLPDNFREHALVGGPNPFFRFRSRAASVGYANDNSERESANDNAEKGSPGNVA